MPQSVLTLLLVLLIVGGGLIVLVAWLIAGALLHPPRMTDAKAVYVLKRLSPEDVGLEFTPVEFTVVDKSRITEPPLKFSSWWMPHRDADGRCVILLHGYADAKVGALAWAPMWHSLRFNILALDLRAHGESQGECTTAGVFERFDVSQVIDQLRAMRSNDTAKVVLFGISLGGAVALATADLRDDIQAIVLESPFSDYAHAATSHAARLGAPTRIVMPLALTFARWRCGADFDSVKPIDLIRKVRCPIMAIHAGADAFVTPADAAEIETALRARQGVSGYLCVEGVGHLMSIVAQPREYQERVADFLNRAINHDP
ncbi:MAG: alpha/beta hydrolase [Tepidisphaeraceae bacterium]